MRADATAQHAVTMRLQNPRSFIAALRCEFTTKPTTEDVQRDRPETTRLSD
jgi:hypothetical protein